jgi:hypothetical protein
MLVADVDSIQAYIDRLAHKFGHVFQFGLDMTTADGSYHKIMAESAIRPNKLQQAVAQYTLGRLSPHCKRVLLNSPPNSGKSRILIAMAVMAVRTNFATEIHIVYPDEHLMERDRADFGKLLLIAKCVDKVHFHVGMSFDFGRKALLIFDEADTFMFDTHSTFETFIKGIDCLCLTGTPSNSKQAGTEKALLQKLSFL